jgi:NADH dehydrogenase/putative oxidoreductase
MKQLLSGALLAARATGWCNRAAPFIDLAVRAWLAQLFWMQGISGVADWHAALAQTPGLAATLAMHPHSLAVALTCARIALPLLLLAGFATRLAALPLAALSLASAIAHPGQDAPFLWALLTGWYVMLGAGPLSLDRLVARGIFHSALPLAPQAGRLLARLSQTARPFGLVLVRCGIAFVLVRHGMANPVPIPALVCLGLFTRVATLPLLAATGMATMHDASNEHLCWTLILLLLAANGPGRFSLDALAGDYLTRLATRLNMMPEQAAADLPHVVIVGGGFGGVAAARSLAAAACRITLVDRHNYHLFQPLLYQVATAGLSPADIATPIRAMFRDQPNVRVVLGEVSGVDREARAVMLSDGSRIGYDTLILATGARHAYFGHDDWESAAPGLKTLDDATSIRRRILLAFERAETESDPARRAAWLTFAVIGGGPTGVELAGAIAELARNGLTHEFRAVDPAQARVLLIQAGDRVLPTFPPELSKSAADALTGLGVDVRCGPAVERVDEGGLMLAGEYIASGSMFWAAGVAASHAAVWLGLPADRAGRLIVQPDLTAPGHPEIFAIGDTAAVDAWEGKPVPGLAPAAKQAGHYVAHVIRARLAGRKPPPPFRYQHQGSLATVGRRAAVADFGRLKLDGALAWWLWGAIHILFLAGTRNRLVVGVQWFWAYLTFGRGIRLITGGAK